MEVRTDTGALVILDAGTGVRELGHALLAQSTSADGITADIFLTHAHWDHIQGIPFFAPIFQAGNTFRFWGSKTLHTSIDRVVRSLMAPVVFPVPFSALKAHVEFAEIGESEEHIGDGFAVRACAMQHPGGALGYRFSSRPDNAGSFVYISDNELGPNHGSLEHAQWRRQLVEFVRGTTLLVHDATYTAEEYDEHRGWGHSTYEDAVELALESGVKELMLFHHSPERTDEAMDERVADCRALVAAKGSPLRITAAAEGMTLSV